MSLPLSPADPAVLPALPVRGATNPCLAHACSACCHDIEMVLTEADLARLRRVRPDEDFWFQAEDGFLQLRTRDGPPARGGEGRPCWFLTGDGRCGVHDDRPEGCRLYPAFFDEEVRRAALDDLYCPHTDGFQLPRAHADAVARLALRLEAERRGRTRGEGAKGGGQVQPR
jgi:Fe-S-cluster containining protein